MEEVGEVKEKKGKENRYGRRYGFEIKLRCVKLYLEEGLPLSLLAKEVGASTDGIRRWVKAYQERGEEGLRNAVRSWEDGGNCLIRCAGRLSSSRSESHSLESSGYLIY